jgi:hypothetical protein
MNMNIERPRGAEVPIRRPVRNERATGVEGHRSGLGYLALAGAGAGLVYLLFNASVVTLLALGGALALIFGLLLWVGIWVQNNVPW